MNKMSLKACSIKISRETGALIPLNLVLNKNPVRKRILIQRVPDLKKYLQLFVVPGINCKISIDALGKYTKHDLWTFLRRGRARISFRRYGCYVLTPSDKRFLQNLGKLK